MSNEVFTREEIDLQDGTTVELRPLTIGRKRKFMRVWSDHITSVTADIKKASEAANAEGEEDIDAFELDESDLNDRQYDTYIKLCVMCLDDIKDGKTEKQFSAYLEDVLDDPTIFRILEVCGGLKLGNDSPN